MLIKLENNAATIKRLAEIEKDNFTGEAWTANMLRSGLKNKQSVTYGVLVDEVIAGYFMVLLTDVCDLCNIVVDKPYRGKGYAKQMMEEIIRLATQYGAESIFLNVNVENVKALTLYKQYGFEVIGIRKRYYPSSEYDSKDAYTMRKIL